NICRLLTSNRPILQKIPCMAARERSEIASPATSSSPVRGTARWTPPPETQRPRSRTSQSDGSSRPMARAGSSGTKETPSCPRTRPPSLSPLPGPACCRLITSFSFSLSVGLRSCKVSKTIVFVKIFIAVFLTEIEYPLRLQ
ncbi:unnamed protein product, partial [Nesidiocoris tenuis]